MPEHIEEFLDWARKIYKNRDSVKVSEEIGKKIDKITEKYYGL